MAENTKEEKALSSLSNLTCPLCLDIFDDARLLTCGHTFCRKCLGEYDQSHQDRDHMVCPLCRKITALTENRVDDLPTNVNVNGLVEDFYGKCGGANAVLEFHLKCTTCKFLGDAVSYCRTCSNYMCEECLQSHQRLTSFFEGHEIISIQDIKQGSVSLGHDSEKCVRHKQEEKDLFCEDCKVHGCLKCVITGHRDHNIKTHEDFEKELQLKVNDLIQRCTSKKSEMEKNIQNLEIQRHEVHAAVQKLRADVSRSYNVKVIQLEENQRFLLEQIEALHRDFDKDLDDLKSRNRCKIKSISSSLTLVANDRLGRLEKDSLSAHTLLCEELDNLLKEANDTSAKTITEKVEKITFQPATDTSLDLGSITELWDLEIIKYVDLQHEMVAVTKYSDDTAAISYFQHDDIDTVDSAGIIQHCPNVEIGIRYYGIVFQKDKTLCITTCPTEGLIFYPNGSRKSTIKVTATTLFPMLSTSSSDEILIANGSKRVYIYDPMGTTLKHTVQTKHNFTRQAFATNDGYVVTSSCSSDPSVVTVYDRDGNAGRPLKAEGDIKLFVAIDQQDNVYTASVDRNSGEVVIRLYDLDGLNLKERVLFNAVNLTLENDWCYLVSLSPGMLAFACYKKVYFMKVPL